MKKILNLLLIVIFTGLLMSSCETEQKTPSSDLQLQKQTEESMKEANSQVGYPAITSFQEKKMMKMLYELRDRADYVCYAYMFSEYTGKLYYLGRCMGYGIPYSTQFSNPFKIAKEYKSTNVGAYAIVLPQPEPNGLFMPDGLAATWLMMIDDETGEQHPVYMEPTIVVSPIIIKTAIGNPKSTPKTK